MIKIINSLEQKYTSFSEHHQKEIVITSLALKSLAIFSIALSQALLASALISFSMILDYTFFSNVNLYSLTNKLINEDPEKKGFEIGNIFASFIKTSPQRTSGFLKGFYNGLFIKKN